MVSKKRKSRTRQRSKSRTQQRRNQKLLDECINGYITRVRKLLKAGANPNAQDADGETAIMYASMYWGRINSHIKIVQMLLKAGANPNIQNKKGNTVLMNLSKYALSFIPLQTEKIIQMLLKAGANPNIQNNDGETALIIASYSGFEKAVRLLLKAGANPNIQDNNGETALMKELLSYHIHDSSFVRASNISIVKLLLKAGANPNLKNKKGNTAYSIAEKIQDKTLVKLLKNAQIKIQTKKHMRRQKNKEKLHNVLKNKSFKYPGLEGHINEYLFN